MRIIAGSARGMNIDTIDGLETRPTLDRVREAIFGSIQFDIPGAVVLDLFSGSGAMGLEAASRGAAMVIMNDISPKCISVIRQNAQRCSLSGKIILHQMDWRELLTLLERQGKHCDIAFLDAPYASGFSVDAAKLLFSLGIMSSAGRVFLEHHTGDDVSGHFSDGIHVKRTKKYGKCSVTEIVRDTQE